MSQLNINKQSWKSENKRTDLIFILTITVKFCHRNIRQYTSNL